MRKDVVTLGIFRDTTSFSYFWYFKKYFTDEIFYFIRNAKGEKKE